MLPSFHHTEGDPENSGASTCTPDGELIGRVGSRR